MATVTYDDRSFMIDDQRIWLTSGSIHYFRVPSELWADRLMKARRAGLNCISTYVAWNVHEPIEGQWQLEGDQDIVQFIRLAQDMGLYVILRPGPYICAEWDFGGFPAWLQAKSGIAYRTDNAAYTHYFDKYFAQILPRLAEMQVSNGGNILLIQNENEYTMTTMPDRLAYLNFITQLFRRSGFTVPIINCNCQTDPPVEDTIECANTWSNTIPLLRRLRSRQPDAPLLVTEYWPGWFDFWGGEHQTRDARTVARRAMEFLGCGSQYNYYMFHGGTNFEFWGSRLSARHDAYQTTSYDYDAPLAEGGGLTEKYYLCRLVNLLSNSMAPHLAACRNDATGATLEDSPDVLNLAGPMGHWTFLTSGGQDDVEELHITLPTGKRLRVPLGILGAAAVPHDVNLPGGQMLDYSTLTPLGCFGEGEKSVLVLHGPESWTGQVCIEHQQVDVEVPKNDTVLLQEIAGATVAVVNSDLAMRTWPLDSMLLFGPAYVGETEEDLHFSPNQKQYQVLTFEDGKLSTRKVKTGEAPRKPAPPRLRNWDRVCICSEPADRDVEWTPLDRPREVDKLGVHYGYCWYRIDLQEDRARKRNLFLPDCADRASLYLNGELQGVWGNGQDATRKPIPVSLKKGSNPLVVLVDNLGRYNFGDRLGEPKGLYGHVYDAKAIKAGKFRLKEAEGFPRRLIPRNLAHVVDDLETLPFQAMETSLTLSSVTPVHLRFNDLPCHLAVVCNDRPVQFFSSRQTNWGELTLGAELKKGKNVIRFLLWGHVDPACLDTVEFHSLLEPLSAGVSWGYRPWEIQTEGPSSDSIKGKSCWFRTTFKCSDLSMPLFLRILGAQKGQMFLNGHNVGRYWTIGPQEYYYLPECWLSTEEDNELLLFDEHGHMPSRCTLHYRPQGPYRP